MTNVAQRSWIQAVRQHHGIEHATLSVLSRRCPQAHVFARSDPKGFIVYGDVDTTELRAAVEEAVGRLQAGEGELAVHPNCGTNIVTAGLLSGFAAFLASGDPRRPLWDRVPSAILAAMAALMIAPPLGRWTQARVTTSSRVDGLRVVSVSRFDAGPLVRHRVTISA